VNSRRGCGYDREIKEEMRIATSAGRMLGNCGTRPEGLQAISAEVLASWARDAIWESMRNHESWRRLCKLVFEDIDGATVETK
jgi:hypothetical protein